MLKRSLVKSPTKRQDTIWIDHVFSSLIDDSYNKADVADILAGLQAILKVTIEKDQKETTTAFANVLTQIMAQADKGGLALNVDIQQLDNPSTMGHMGALEKGMMGAALLPGLAPLGAPKPKPAALAPIQTAPAGPSERELELEESTKSLADKLSKVQQQFSTMMQEKSKLTQELNRIKDLSESSAANEAAKVIDLQKQLDEARTQLERKDTEVQSHQKELTGKLSESQQFKTLKKLLAQKNQQVKDMRTKLSKYEPEAGSTTIELEESSSSEDDQ
eukprot:NODE_704_length_1497_cov_99.196823_g581_i0.p1 GENE.NODE_704_length_1497_cov_99.196823_g581_i0~~NODE_704_length_1497_cov_99.196823_g581_i0.p1  ORF type:complete len:276 (-),score=83.57 NODE_704_length_1497_cov_99.196823_g581_i0:225-1052(-)